MFRHELSLDEARPWLIVSETPVAGLVKETRCEMHCLPWFYSLKGLSEIFSGPLAMQIFGVVLGTVAFALIALFSPFTLVEKVLLLLNYYLLFEFNLIARPYALMSIGLFLACATFPERRSRPARFLGSILVLSHSTYFGIFLTFPFMSLYLFELLSGQLKMERKKLLKSSVLIGLYVFSVVWYSLPLSSRFGCVDLSMTNLPVNFERFVETTWDVARAFFVLGNETWNEHVFDYDPTLKGVLSGFWIVSVLGITWALRKSPRSCYLFVASVFLLFTYRFTKPVYYGSFLRHLGALSLMYVGCMWIAGKESPSRNLLSRAFFSLFLLFGAYSGVRLYLADFLRPFSSGPAVHRFISQEPYRGLKIVPDSLLFTSSYLVYSDRKYIDYLASAPSEVRYYPLSTDLKRVYVAPAHIRGHHIVPKVREDVFRSAISEYVTGTPAPLVIINYPAVPGFMEGFGLVLVESFTGAVNPNEDYYIYTRKQ